MWKTGWLSGACFGAITIVAIESLLQYLGLIDALGLAVSDVEKTLLGELNQFYLEGRYPGKINELARAMDQGKAVYYLQKTTGVWQCLKQTLL